MPEANVEPPVDRRLRRRSGAGQYDLVPMAELALLRRERSLRTRSVDLDRQGRRRSAGLDCCGRAGTQPELGGAVMRRSRGPRQYLADRLAQRDQGIDAVHGQIEEPTTALSWQSHPVEVVIEPSRTFTVVSELDSTR